MIGEANGRPIILVIATAAVMAASVMWLGHTVVTRRARHPLDAGLFFEAWDVD
jgi:hypothetical protein